VPCGLIASELISNALKHAFVGRQLGLLNVAVRGFETGVVELEVADDGVGLAPNASGVGSSSLGMQLVRGLVKQLDGTLVVENGRGARFVVSFPQRPVTAA
jgi:two-component sensor histidine kinase